MAEITRADAAAILASQTTSEIIKPATESSVVLGTFRTIPMSARTLTQPMLASLPDAYFVTDGPSDGHSVASGTKPTTSVSWTDKSMTAEEMAVIVPVHENLLADASVDIWSEVRPLIAEAFAIKLDNAVLYGAGATSQVRASWPDADIVGKAITAGNVVARGTSRDLAEDFNQVLAAVEDDDYDVTDVFAVKRLKSALRGLRDDNGQPIYSTSLRSDGATPELLGATLRYMHRRIVDPRVEALALDATQYQVGIREDFQVKFLDQATVNGINLAERDMVALRFKFRVAFGSFRSPLLHDGDDYPAAVLGPVAAG